jgi:HlyD family type I secretion membrane fusion protein
MHVPFLRTRKRDDDSIALISAFESETQAVIVKTAPYSDHAILHGISALVVIALILMSVLKLDRVVTASGRVLPTAGSFYVQPLDRAIIREILVHTGDVVRKGEVLATLDPTFSSADAVTLEQKHASDAALVDRLEAEQAGVAYRPKSNDPQQMLQLSDWRQRQSNYTQSLADFDAKIASTTSVLAKSEDDVRDYSQHLAVASDLESRMLKLEASGYGAAVRTLSARDTRIDATRTLEEAKDAETQSRHDLAALKAERAVYVATWHDALATALVAARNDLNQSTQDLVKAERVRDLTQLTAPADAVVLQIAPASAGSVIDPNTSTSQPLFTLVPLAGRLEAEVRIPSRDIGFVKLGDRVRVKLDAYRFLQHGTVDGVVKTLSEGTFIVDDNGQPTDPYFKARVSFTRVRLHNVPSDFRLIPGMTLTGDILVGHRTILSYIVEGALRTGHEAMREP